MKNNDFKPLPLWRELLLKEISLPDYYRQKREYIYEHGNKLKGLKWRDAFHPVLYFLMKLARKFNKQTLTILDDKSVRGDKPVIFAITHVGMYDYQIVSEALKDHQIPFAGDPETMYRSGDGFLLNLNGVIMCDTEDKKDRKIATDTAKKVIESGHNLLIYPEGVWNLTPNLLSLPLFPGIINMAMDTGAEIVPVAIEQYDKDFVVNIGENFVVDNVPEEERKDFVSKRKEDLRDVMCSLKWEILESRSPEERNSLLSFEELDKQFVDGRLNEWVNPKTKRSYYTRELVKSRTFSPKNIVLNSDAFGFFKNIKLSRKNAFLYRKDLSISCEIKEEKDRELRRGRM